MDVEALGKTRTSSVTEAAPAIEELLTAFSSVIGASTSTSDVVNESEDAAADATPPDDESSFWWEKLPIPMQAFAQAERKQYIRPNGETYIPRTYVVNEVAVQDITIVRTAHKTGMPILFFGPPGTGKTALIEAALNNVITLQGTLETEAADLVGSWIQKPDGKYEWSDGPLIQAMQLGCPLLIDEIALIDPRILSIVYSVMDGRNTLKVTANPDRGDIAAKEGFAVYGACNPDVPGAMLSDALLSRFALHITVKTDWSIAKKLGVSSKLITVARNLQIKFESGQITSTPQLRELLAAEQISSTFGIRVALSNLIGQARPENRHVYTEVIESMYGSAVSDISALQL